MIEQTNYTADIDRILLEFEMLSEKHDMWDTTNGTIFSYPFNTIEGKSKQSAAAFYGDESQAQTLDIFKGTYIEKVINDLPFKRGRCRFLLMKPPTIMRIHRDPSIRWHLPLYTNDYCGFMDGNLKTYTMPVNGHWYKLNTRELHSAFNIDRESPRLHLVVVESYSVNDNFKVV